MPQQLDLEPGTPRSLERAQTPMDLLQLAIERQGSIEIIERLAKLQREEREYSAKVAFESSMMRAQKRMKSISTDATNPQTHSRYATYSKLDKVLRPIYTEEGFAVSYGTADCAKPEVVRVTAHLSHEQGHSRDYQLDMPADGKGAKGGDVMTKTHATGAATQYGMRYLLKMIFNVAIGEDDTDGVPAGSMPDQQYVVHEDNIKNSGTVDELKRMYQAALNAAKACGDAQAESAFANAKNARYRELQAGAR